MLHINIPWPKTSNYVQISETVFRDEIMKININ